MISNIDLILASILTANLTICSIVGFPNCLFNTFIGVIAVFCLLCRNDDFTDDDFGGY